MSTNVNINDKCDTVVLYHRGCNDGTAAAWAASKVLPEGVQYVQYQYGEELPETVYGKHLILVDLSLTKEQIESIYPNHVKTILIIDHHKTAIEKLAGLPALYSYNEYCRVRDDVKCGIWMLADTSHSGAVLTWAFFNNCLTKENWTFDVPQVLRYVEDYDLWKFNFEHTDAVNAWIINCGNRIELFDTAVNDDGNFVDSVFEIGKEIVEYDVNIVKSVAKGYVQEGEWNGYKYAMVNAPHHLRNRIGDLLNKRYDFTICYNQRKERTIVSLRGNSDIDLTEIGRAFGGGGHASAAAFSVENNTYRKLLAENPFNKPTFKQRVKLLWWALTTKRLV